jgi:hypothetical protein
MFISYSEDNPKGLTYILAAEFDIWSELGVIRNSRRTPSLGHTSGFVAMDMAVVIRAIIDIHGIQFCGTVI